MGKAITGIVFFTAIAKILGFVRELLLSYFFGATGISDAYLISQTIPGTIFQLVGTGMTTCFIPVYYKVLQEKGRSSGDKFTNQIISVVFLFSTCAIGIVWAQTPLVVKLFASGFQGETLHYAIVFTRIGISSLYFSTLLYVYNSYLQANNIFAPTAFAAIPNSLVIIASIILGACWNIMALSIGSVLATAVQLILLWYPIRKLGFRLRLNFQWNDPFTKQFFCLMLPVIFGVSINEVNMLVDRTVASSISVGGISALTYANSLIMFIQGGLVQPIITVFYPKLTSLATENNVGKLRQMIEKAVEIILAILFPITVGMILFSGPITEMLFGRGAFDSNASRLTASAVLFYSIGLIPIGLREIVSRLCYVFGDTKTPMKNATVGMLINIVLNLTLSRLIGIGGVAFSTSIAAFVTVVLIWIKCKRSFTDRLPRIDKREVVKVSVASLVMGMVAALVYSNIEINSFVRLFLTVMIATIVYFSLLFALKAKVFMEVFVQIRSFLMRENKMRENDENV